MNLFKKTTAAVALVTLVSSVFTTGVSAYSTSEIEAANTLAQAGVIVDQSANPAAYNLDQNVLRQEIAAVARGVAGLDKETVYASVFSDVTATTPNTWAWASVNALANAGLVAKNPTFRPEANISKAEAVGMVVKASFGDAYAYDATLGTSWQEQVVAFAVANGVVSNFTNYDTAATRGFVFEAAANAMSSNEDDEMDDIICTLLGTCGTDEEDNTDDTTVTPPVVVTGGDVEVSLSPSTATASTIPGNISGLPVVSFDLSAGSEDVTVTSVTLKRRGLSDSATLTGLAAFTADGRVSKAKDDTQENNTEATLTFTNGLVVKAGETKTVTVVADVASAAVASGDEFSIELKEVISSSDVEFVGSLVGNTMKVGGVNAASVSVEANGSVSNPTLGAENADIFKFQIVGATDEDVILKSITFKSDSSDAEDDLANFVLLNNTKEVAATASMNGKYLTFNLGNGLTIGEDKTEKFTVRADVVAGAGDIFGFAVDKKLDVTAEGTKYGYGAAITVSEGTLLGNQVTVQAGELTLVDIDATSDKVREDKDNVVLGSVKVTNVSGGNLELQKFGVLATLTAGTAFVDDGSGVGGVAGDGIKNGTEAAVALNTIFENFELVASDNGAAYELDLVGNVYQDTDLNITIPQGTTEFSFRADTKKSIVNFDTASVVFTLDASLNVGKTDDANLINGSFLVVELEDDKPVSDLTPSSLSWKKVSGTESSATVARVPLSSITKVRGATDVVALQFEVEADESSALTMDEAKVFIEGPLVAVGASSQEVAQVTLYKGSVSESNLLDRVSGSNLASGVATFDGFETSIAANAKQTFVVTVSVVDGADAVGTVNARLNSISVEDEDNDDVEATFGLALLSAGNPAISSRNISVVNFGTLTLSEDANNDDNKDNKTVLAGTSKVVFSIDVQSQNESVDVETVTFNVDQDLRNAAVNASLYLDNTLVATNANSDITATSITFKNLTSLVIPQETKELKLAINTASIGFEKVGATVTSLNVTSVTLDDATGVDSGKDVSIVTAAGIATSKDVSIVPVAITPSVTSSISGGQGKLKITIDAGSNTVNASNSTPSITLTNLVFSQLGNTAEADAYKIYKEGESARFAYITSAGVLDNTTPVTPMSAADLTISSSTTYVIVPKGTVDKTYTLNLTKDGIVYTVNGVAGSTGLKTNIANELELGSKSY